MFHNQVTRYQTTISRFEYLLGVTDFETAQDYDLIKDIQNQDGFLNYVGTLLSEHFEDYEKVPRDKYRICFYRSQLHNFFLASDQTDARLQADIHLKFSWYIHSQILR